MEATGSEDGPGDESPADIRWRRDKRRLSRWLSAMAALAGERVDSVEIIVTIRTPDGKTATLSKGRGNYFARLGSVREWLIVEDARTRRDAVGE